jgi:hypothetical protein
MLMDPIGEIILRLKISELEALLVLCEIERLGLNREIEDPETTFCKRSDAERRRDRVIVEWGQIMTQLHDLRGRQERELGSRPGIEHA